MAVENMKHTPLYEFHLKNQGRMVPFAGWMMPIQYTSILEEHRAVREGCGLFDVSHMGEIMISGEDAEEFLNFLVTNEITTLNTGKACYAFMCYSDGGVVDDLLVYRLGERLFLLCVNAANTEKDYEWISQNVKNWDCDVENVSDSYAQLAVQGPHSVELLTTAGFPEVGAIDRFAFAKVPFKGESIIISRTGYTGEDGFEIYLSPELATDMSELLWDKGSSFGLKLAGLGARDSLRLEAGFPLYGHEISDKINPLEAGLKFAVKLDGEDFMGKEALVKYLDSGSKKRVHFFCLEDKRIARQGEKVFQSGNVVGEVLSGTFSPMINQGIGSFYLESGSLEDLYVELRGKKISLSVAKPPLHKR